MEKRLEKWLDDLDTPLTPDEFEAKQLVNLYSINTPKSIRVSPEQSYNIDDLQSPYVIKVCSSSIVHKTDQQGVLLNNDKENLAFNFKQMRQRFPKEKMIIENQTNFMGPEFIIGIIKDPVLGHAVMVGAGGILTEIYNDTAFRLAPCTVIDANDMIDELVLSPVFENFRGLSLDKDKLAQTISKVSELAHDMGDQLSQLDINPIVYSNNEWMALDVKVMFEMQDV